MRVTDRVEGTVVVGVAGVLYRRERTFCTEVARAFLAVTEERKISAPS